MNIKKREGYVEEFNRDKIFGAVMKAFEEVGDDVSPDTIDEVVDEVESYIFEDEDSIVTVEDIQDRIETVLIELGFLQEARAFIKYRQERSRVRSEGWKLDDLQNAIWENKYRYADESFDDWIERVSGGNQKVAKLIRQKKFIFAGRILAHRGLGKLGKRVTYSNCYVMTPPEDNIESIFETAKELARTYSAGGGCGVDISKLRPAGMPVNNSARTTSGATSFMSLYDLTTGLIGQNGRRGALMISIDVSHPDSEDFIDIKTKEGSITKANISIKVDDEFMLAVNNNSDYTLHWKGDNGQELTKTVNARDLYMKNVRNNWDWAEAGFLFWDTIKKRHMMSAHPEHEFAGVNPCAEEPLMSNGSCLLGSLNLSEFVVHPFSDMAYFDFDKFAEAVETGVTALNEVLDEGMSLHPLQGQRDNARDWRQIGLGVMGLADMFIKLGIKYGSVDSLMISDSIGFTLQDRAIRQSAVLAGKYGAFPKYHYDSLMESEWFNCTPETLKLVEEHGLRNSQLLTIAPTGSISTMWGISGGLEPIFAKTYKRKTESIYGSDFYFDVFTPIVNEAMNLNNTKDVPDYIVTAHDLNWKDRIKMQATWQRYVDASISSTVNLPKETTVEECYDLFLEAWLYGLKGITIFRDGCKRMGILTIDEDDVEAPEEATEAYEGDTKYSTCPECGEPIEVIQGACSICMNCGNSGCE